MPVPKRDHNCEKRKPNLAILLPLQSLSPRMNTLMALWLYISFQVIHDFKYLNTSSGTTFTTVAVDVITIAVV